MISKGNVKFTDSNFKLIAAIMRLSLFSSKQCIILVVIKDYESAFDAVTLIHIP